MNLSLPVALSGCLAAVSGFCPPLAAQDFRYGIEAPDDIHPGERFEASVRLTSTGIPDGERGPEGWQTSLAHRHLEIVSATTDGTIVDEFTRDGFAHTEITEGPTNDGFTSVVVLSLENDVALPPEGSWLVARAVYRVTDAACLEGAALELRDGLEGSGLPVTNRVSWRGQSVRPRLDARVWAACLPNRYRLSLEPAANPVIGIDGERIRFPVDVMLEQESASTTAWTLAVSHPDADLRLLDVAVAEGIEAHLGADGFALIEITRGAGNTGLVAQVELSATGERVLPSLREPVLRAVYEVVDPPPARQDLVTSLRFAESLRGSGGPVVNAVFPEGLLDIASPLSLRVSVLSHPPILRADANGDGDVDIGDPIATLFHLFIGELAVCREAADSNGDDALDVGDIIYTLNHLFLEGPPPPAPYPACGLVDDGLGCERRGCL